MYTDPPMRWLLLLITTSLCAFTLKDSLIKGSPGDFVVFEQNKLITLLNIHSLSDTSLIIEEISLPSHLKPKDWHSFAKNKAPQATSHLLYEISLSSGDITECYSCTKKTFLPPPAFLHKLLLISLTPPETPKKIGTEPPEGTPDRRPLWAPPRHPRGSEKASHRFFYLYWPLALGWE